MYHTWTGDDFFLGKLIINILYNAALAKRVHTLNDHMRVNNVPGAQMTREKSIDLSRSKSDHGRIGHRRQRHIFFDRGLNVDFS